MAPSAWCSYRVFGSDTQFSNCTTNSSDVCAAGPTPSSQCILDTFSYYERCTGMETSPPYCGGPGEDPYGPPNRTATSTAMP